MDPYLAYSNAPDNINNRCSAEGTDVLTLLLDYKEHGGSFMLGASRRELSHVP